MDPQALVKALLINAAYEGAIAVCTPLDQESDGKPLPIDPLIQDTGLQKKGVLVYEEAKVQYNALLRAFEDKSGVWPDPKVAASAPSAPDIAGTLANLLKGLPSNSPIATVGQLLGLLAQAGVAMPVLPGQELAIK